MSDNPFIPSFGASPLYLAGREEAIASIERVSLNRARVDYGRASLIIGQRGIGKTVLLNAVEDLADKDDWLMVQTTATRGFLARMVTEQLRPILEDLKPSRATKTSANIGLNVGFANARWASKRHPVPRTLPVCASTSLRSVLRPRSAVFSSPSMR